MAQQSPPLFLYSQRHTLPLKPRSEESLIHSWTGLWTVSCSHQLSTRLFPNSLLPPWNGCCTCSLASPRLPLPPTRWTCPLWERGSPLGAPQSLGTSSLRWRSGHLEEGAPGNPCPHSRHALGAQAGCQRAGARGAEPTPARGRGERAGTRAAQRGWCTQLARPSPGSETRALEPWVARSRGLWRDDRTRTSTAPRVP